MEIYRKCSILQKGQINERNESLPEWVKSLIDKEEQPISDDSLDAVRARYNKMRKGD